MNSVYDRTSTTFYLAGTHGFEPRYADPESAVLPLDDVPAGRGKQGVVKRQPLVYNLLPIIAKSRPPKKRFLKSPGKSKTSGIVSSAGERRCTWIKPSPAPSI